MKKTKHYLSEDPILSRQYIPEENDNILASYITTGTHKLLPWRCDKGHVWYETIAHRKRGDGCPYCSGKRVIPSLTSLSALFPEVAKKWNYNKNLDLAPEDVRPNSAKKVWWICDKGHEWQSKISDMVNKNINCPYCYGRYPIPGETDLATKNPLLAAQFHPTKNGTLKAAELTEHSNKKVWWICDKGHEWPATVNNRSKGKGCPVCAGRLPVVGVNDLMTINPDFLIDWDYKNNKKSPSEFTLQSNAVINWTCSICGNKWRAKIASRARGYGKCPYCGNHNVNTN